jgi:hypothetical protein
MQLKTLDELEEMKPRELLEYALKLGDEYEKLKDQALTDHIRVSKLQDRVKILAELFATMDF